MKPFRMRLPNRIDLKAVNSPDNWNCGRFGKSEAESEWNLKNRSRRDLPK